MSTSQQSREKIEFLSNAFSHLTSYRRQLETGAADVLAVAQVTNALATDRVYNGMTNIVNGFFDLIDHTVDSLGAQAETLVANADILGPDFEKKIRNISDDFASMGHSTRLAIRHEASGLDEDLSPEARTKLHDAILSIMSIRKKYIVELAEYAGGAMTDPNFKQVIIDLGNRSENLTNEMTTHYNSINDKLVALGIRLDKQFEDLMGAAKTVGNAGMPIGNADAAMDV